MRFPRKWKGHSEFELKKPSTATILALADRAENGRRYSSMLALMEGAIESIDGKEPEDLREMPLINAEYVAREAFRLYKLPTLVEGVYQCPRCNHSNIHEEKTGKKGVVISDTRDDVANLEVVYCNHEDNYTLELAKGNEVVLKNNYNGKIETVAEIRAFVFRDPTIADMMRIESDATLKDTSRRVNKLYYSCLVDVDGDVVGGDDFNGLKNKFMYELLDFPDFGDWARIAPLLHQYGMQPFIDVTCERCQKEFSDPVDFTGFFVSALLSQSRKKAGR
jgi:hypothetical protein